MNLQQLVNEISISQDSISNVTRAKNYLLEKVASYSNDDSFPSLMESRIIGSYKRKTKIDPLNDVDIILVLGKGYYQGNNWHIISDCSYPFSLEDKDEDGNISSIKILNTLRNKLSETYPNSEIKRNNEVVNVFLSSYGVGFDLVPAFYYSDVKYFLIPKGSRSTKWKKTNPLIDEIILDDINSKNGFKIKDVIKISKHFFSYKQIPSLRSYHLESCAFFIFNEISGNYSLRDYLEYFYSKLDRRYLNGCKDPTNISEDLSSNLDSTDIEKITTELNSAIDVLKISEEKYCEYVGF